MPDRVIFTDPYLHRLNANGWTCGLMQLKRLSLDMGVRDPHSAQQGPAVEIDLSRATFADFPILGRLLILATALTIRGVNLTVRMPSDNIFPDEHEMLAHSEREIARNARYGFVERLRRQRMNCRLYLSQSGFTSSLKTGPLEGKVAVDEGDKQPLVYEGLSVTVNLDPDSQEKHRAPQRRRLILPYRWLDNINDTRGGQMPDLSDVEHSLTAMGLPSYDATAVAQGILRELIENVWCHSTTGTNRSAHALLGASLVQPSSYKTRLQDFDECLQPFVQWASSINTPLLRLFVGDAGHGIQEAANASRRSNVPGIEDAIIAALNYHPPTPARTAGPRGLWKVKELVRTFQGSVITFSGPAAVGYVFNPHASKVNSDPPFPLPGTVVECDLPTSSVQETEPAPGGGSAFPSLTEPPPANLRCVAALLRSGIGLDRIDIAEIEETLRPLGESPPAGVVISVEMRPGEASPNDWDIQLAMRQIYDLARLATADAMIAVVFAGVSWRLLALAVMDLNLQLDIETPADTASFGISMLIMTADRLHYWVGGSPGLRKVLYRLSHSGQAQRLITISNLLEQGEALLLMEAAPALRCVLTFESGMVRLAFHPHHVISALTNYCRHRLALAAAEQHSDADTKEVFVTPSLREVGRWVDVRNALHSVKCTRIAGFLMAAGVQEKISLQHGSPLEIQVIRLGSLEEELAATFALSLTGSEREVGFEELANMRTIRPDATSTVVVCTGIISNGASVRRAIRELWHLGFSNVAVAAIIDARDRTRTIDGKKEDSEHLIVYGNEVPLFSLTSVSVALDKPGELHRKRIFIDPVIRQPMPSKYPRSKTFMHQKSYKDAICRSDAARLGHIRRSGRRHYAAYIDVGRLFADAEWSRLAFRMMIERIDIDRTVAGCNVDGESAACVIYPGEPNENLTNVAQQLVDEMRTDTDKRIGIRRVDAIPVPRAVVNGEWIFPRMLHLPNDIDNIVAIDSSSRTGATLRHLIRLAAQPQIKTISVFSLVNGMSDLESLALQEIASVRARACDSNGAWSERLVTVNVRYLVRTAAGSNGGGNCSQCALRDEYAALPTMPEALERHRTWVLGMLESRSRQSVFADTLADLYGMQVEQGDCIEYLLWRSYLAEAALDTETRLVVVNIITELANKCRTANLPDDLRRRRDALVRVLAAEIDRLVVAPLWFTSVRAKISTILWSLVEAPNSYTIDQALRVQVVIALSHADVHGFAARYAQLIRESCDNDLVLRQVLLETVRLVNGRSGLPDWYNTLADQISMLSQEVLMSRESVTGALTKVLRVEELDYLGTFMEDADGDGAWKADGQAGGRGPAGGAAGDH